MTILVTGGAGFIGKELIKRLNHLGYNDIVVIDKKSEYPRLKGVTFSEFYDYEVILENNNYSFLKGIEFCFHIGANSSTRSEFKEIINSNVAFSLYLFKETEKRNIPVVFASSGAVYDNDRKENPMTAYGATKLLCEKFASENVVCLRYHNVYGATEHHKWDMASMIHKWFYGDTKLFEGSENILRDFVHVDDINTINIMFFDFWNKNGKFKEKIYDVGTGKAVSFEEVSKEISKHIKTEYCIIPNPYHKITYQFYTKANIEPIAELYKETYSKNFSPISIKDGVEKVYICLQNKN